MLLGIFSGLLSSLPRAGQWMDWIKKGFGVAMLIVAAFFFYQAVVMFVHSGGSP
jgi:thiol:disulfide interchange protein DsbD